MPLLRINATDKGLRLHHTGSDALPQIDTLSRQTSGPAIVMIHGYKYYPGIARHCPHRKLFGAAGANWPRALGFGRCEATEGLGIAFGWSARGPLRRMHRRATGLGASLAGLIRLLKVSSPERPVHVIAHSLGSEIALAALDHLPPQSVNRVLLLTGASFSGFAADMLATSAGQTAEIFNVTSRENDVFDFAFETLAAPPRPGDRAIGLGLDLPNVLNVQLDCEKTLSVLTGFGGDMACPSRRICHWSTYTRPGAMAFYAQLLRSPEAQAFQNLRDQLPDQVAPRWSGFATAPVTSDLRRATASALLSAGRAVRRKAHLLVGTSAEPKAKEPAF